MEKIERNEFYERLCQQSRLLAALYYRYDKAAEATEASSILTFTRWPHPLEGTSPGDFLYERSRDIEDLLLNGTKLNDDPGLTGLDGICRLAELQGRSINAQGGHPFDIVVETIDHWIPEQERTRWSVVMHPAVWMDVRRDAHMRWYEAAVDGVEKKVAGAQLITTELMEDRSILMFREDAVEMRLSDVDLSKTKTEPPGDRALLLLRLELDPDHVKLVHNLG